jgi:hypothetical protein
MKKSAPRINWDDDDARVPIPLPGRRADGQPTHRSPRWGGRRRGSGRKPHATSAAQFVKLGCALTPQHVALLSAHRYEFETSSYSASLRMILDWYIASVPGLAEILDQIAGRPRGRTLLPGAPAGSRASPATGA